MIVDEIKIIYIYIYIYISIFFFWYVQTNLLELKSFIHPSKKKKILHRLTQYSSLSCLKNKPLFIPL